MDPLKTSVEQVKNIVNETNRISNQQFDFINEISNAMHNLSLVAEEIEGLAKKL